jgi:hypothetical protein
VRNIDGLKIILIGYALVFTGCAAPSEPSSLSSSGVEKPAKEGAGKDVKSSSGTGFDFGGALVGDESMQKTVGECVSTGMLFDRKELKCTSLALAKMNCRIEPIKAGLTADRKAQIETLLSGSLAGYSVDQCLDCSSPAGNVACEGTGATKQTAPGYRIYFVKPDSGAIRMQSVYIPE